MELKRNPPAALGSAPTISKNFVFEDEPEKPKPGRDVEAGTLSFYQQHANDFAERANKLDVSHLYPKFLDRIPAGGRILDAGCGSGRDAKAFIDKGYLVAAMDPSEELLEKVKAFGPEKTIHGSFGTLSEKEQYDGIWAMASLLHVAKKDTADAFQRCHDALKKGGVMFFSYKVGNGESHDKDGRFFNYMTEHELRGFLSKVPGFTIKKLNDQVKGGSSGGVETFWIEGLLEKQ